MIRGTWRAFAQTATGKLTGGLRLHPVWNVRATMGCVGGVVPRFRACPCCANQLKPRLRRQTDYGVGKIKPWMNIVASSQSPASPADPRTWK